MTRGKRVGAIFVILAAVLLVGAWIASIVLRPKFPTPAAITARMQQQAALTGGAQVYVTRCAYCHDTGFAPSIAGREWPVAVLTAFVRSGPGSMQSFTPTQVSDQDIEAVADYVRHVPPLIAKQP